MSDFAKKTSAIRQFSFDDIKSATNNFDHALILGRGGFGSVYKGVLDKGATIVAIKRFHPSSTHGKEEFLAEVNALSSTRHVHIVAFIGYCYLKRNHEMLLVYEYMSNGSLADHLYGNKKSKGYSTDHVSPLTWERRLKICLGVAQALSYLHGDGDIGPGFIHRDVKTSNILLDEHWIPKISDFGLCKDTRGYSDDDLTTNVRGTFGYLDPEYYSTGRLTKRSDVYGFGVVMLELLCGRKVVDHAFAYDSEQYHLVPWALQCIKDGKLDSIIDPSLREEVSLDSMELFAQVAIKCLHMEAKKRPTMAEVASSLKLASMPIPYYGTFTKCSGERPTMDEVLASGLKLPSMPISETFIKVFPVFPVFSKASDHGERRKEEDSDSVLSRDEHKQQEQVSDSTQTTRYYFDEEVVIGNDCSSKIYKSCVSGRAKKATEEDGNKSKAAKSSEPQLTPQLKGQEESRLNQRERLKVQNGKETSSRSKTGLVASLRAYMRGKKGKEHSSRLNTGGRKRSSDGTNTSSQSIDSPVLVGAKEEESTTGCNDIQKLVIGTTKGKEIYSESESEGRPDDFKQKHGASTLTSPLSTSFAIEGDHERIKVDLKDGVIILKDNCGEEVRLDLEIFNGIKKNIQPMLLQIIEQRPDTFMQIGKLSSIFAKLIMEAFGGLLELFEQTVLKNAGPNAFDEMLLVIQDLKRSLLKVDWLEDKVKAMAAKVRSDHVNTKLKLTTLKITECRVLLDELKKEKNNLEIEARHLEKLPHHDLFHLEMEGNATQVLL